MRIQYRAQKTRRKLSAASVEYLLDPAHRMCLVMFLMFWASWTPFTIQAFRFLNDELKLPSAYVIWLGCLQGIWKFPIMIVFCPRYRQYLSNVRCSKYITATEMHLETETETNEYNPDYNSEQLNTLTSTLTDDTELHV